MHFSLFAHVSSNGLVLQYLRTSKHLLPLEVDIEGLNVLSYKDNISLVFSSSSIPVHNRTDTVAKLIYNSQRRWLGMLALR